MHKMNQSKKVVGRRDYWRLYIYYGKYQRGSRYLIGKDINIVDGVESLFDGIKWFNEFVSENERDLAFAGGEISHTSVAIVEDEDGDEEEDWNDVEEVGGKSLYWDRSYLDDDDDDTVKDTDKVD